MTQWGSTSPASSGAQATDQPLLDDADPVWSELAAVVDHAQVPPSSGIRFDLLVKEQIDGTLDGKANDPREPDPAAGAMSRRIKQPEAYRLHLNQSG
jgi:hypothetical protein